MYIKRWNTKGGNNHWSWSSLSAKAWISSPKEKGARRAGTSLPMISCAVMGISLSITSLPSLLLSSPELSLFFDLDSVRVQASAVLRMPQPLPAKSTYKRKQFRHSLKAVAKNIFTQLSYKLKWEKAPSSFPRHWAATEAQQEVVLSAYQLSLSTIHWDRVKDLKRHKPSIT